MYGRCQNKKINSENPNTLRVVDWKLYVHANACEAFSCGCCKANMINSEHVRMVYSIVYVAYMRIQLCMFSARSAQFRVRVGWLWRAFCLFRMLRALISACSVTVPCVYARASQIWKRESREIALGALRWWWWWLSPQTLALMWGSRITFVYVMYFRNLWSTKFLVIFYVSIFYLILIRNFILSLYTTIQCIVAIN